MHTAQTSQPLDRALALVETALEDLETARSALSSIIRKCIRIARLRNDYRNLWWLEVEMSSTQGRGGRIAQEVAAHFSKAEYVRLAESCVEAYCDERRMLASTDDNANQANILALSVEEIEDQITQATLDIASASTPQGLHPQDLYLIDKERTKLRAMLANVSFVRKQILSRIRQRVHDFLSTTEKELIYGQLNSDLFEQNRRFVDIKLRELSPDALDKMSSAYRRLGENDTEARAQATTSCRRVLKAVADSVFPPRAEPVRGADGKTRDLGEEKYIARLWQFVSEKLGKSTSSKLLNVTISDLGGRIDRIYELSCKGVHDEVSPFEVNQCVIQTYLLVGDILRLADSDSGADASNEGSA